MLADFSFTIYIESRIGDDVFAYLGNVKAQNLCGMCGLDDINDS
jgi:hypothetical protein